MKTFTWHPDLVRLLACINDLEDAVADVPLEDEKAVTTAVEKTLVTVGDPDSIKAIAEMRTVDITAEDLAAFGHQLLASVWTEGFMTGAMFAQRGGHVDS